MAKKVRSTFYLALIKKGDLIVGHATADSAAKLKNRAPAKRSEPAADKAGEASSFKEVFAAYKKTMESYRKFIPLSLGFAPFMIPSLADKHIGQLARTKGKLCSDESSDEVLIYEMDMNCYREYKILGEQIASAIEGSKRLPEIMVGGLISSYDAFLTQLLKVVLYSQGEVFFRSDKSISYSELLKFESMEDAKKSLVDVEVEGIIRSSHHEHFAWMERNFDLKLREGLSVWPLFVEICERRNLLTHTGGFVSKQYIDNCKSHKVASGDIKVGDKLTVDNNYFSRSVDVLYEVGVKLCFVLWRKFAKAEADEADGALNELAFDLIHGRAYGVAEAILSFGVNGFKGGKRVKHTMSMMTINLANAIRLQDRAGDAKSMLNEIDWSDSDPITKLGVAAVKGDIDEVVVLMKAIGNTGQNAEHYRTWPVFRGLENDPRFGTAFQRIFKERLLVPVPASKPLNVESEEALNADVLPLPPTKH